MSVKMTINEIKEKLKTSEYDFLRNFSSTEHPIVLLGFGGSYAYGTNTETSDIDIRGVATNSKRNILCGKDFDNFRNDITDTTIYSLEKFIKLASSCNPSIIELLGLKPEHYFYINDVGQLLIDNKSLFLSSRVATTFAGCITSQIKLLHTVYTRNTTKQMMHIARLYIMGEEILSTGKINTFREKEHNLLMSIRNGDFIDKEKEIPTQEFWTLINTLQANFYYAEKHTILPQHINTEKIYDLLESINEKIVKNN